MENIARRMDGGARIFCWSHDRSSMARILDMVFPYFRAQYYNKINSFTMQTVVTTTNKSNEALKKLLNEGWKVVLVTKFAETREFREINEYILEKDEKPNPSPRAPD